MQGQEHLVLLDEQTSQVVKITLPGTYGDYYEIIDGRINQFDSTPAEYLLRMRWWEKLFSSAPDPIGMTESGQIVSGQRSSTAIRIRRRKKWISSFSMQEQWR